MNRLKKELIVFAIAMAILLSPYLVCAIYFENLSPFSVVVSQSMYPTLNRGDLVLVRGNTAVYVENIIVFHRPLINANDTGELIVHRIVYSESINGYLFYQTKGDNGETNPTPDYWVDYRGFPYTHNGMIGRILVVGKVNYIIPSVGVIVLFIQTPNGLTFTLILLFGSFIVEYGVEWLVKKHKPHEIQSHDA